MKLSETIKFIFEIAGREVFFSDVFINMLEDYGAFTEMPFGKSILKQIWEKDYHNQISMNLHNESNLRQTFNRIIANLNANNGFERVSLIKVCNELIQGLDINLIIESDNDSFKSIDKVTSTSSLSHLFFQGFSMANSIKSLSSLLIRNNNYTIVEDKGETIEMSGEYAGMQASSVILDSGEEKYTKNITIVFYEENETLRNMKGQLLMTKLTIDYGQPDKDPIFGLKWISDGGFVYILPYQEVVAVVYMNEYHESSGGIKKSFIENELSIEYNNFIKDFEVLNFLSFLKNDYNPFLSSVNGIELSNRKISKYEDGVQWDIKLGKENAKFVILKSRDYDSEYSIRSILLLTELSDNWDDLYKKYKFFQSCFDKLFGKQVISSETFDEYYEGPGDEINSLQEYSNGCFASWYFNYAGVVLLEIRNAQVRIGYYHLPKNIDDLGKMKFMGLSMSSPKQEIINKIFSLGGISDVNTLKGSYYGYKCQFFIDEKFGKTTNIDIRIDTDSLINIDEEFKNIRSNLINIYGEPEFETGNTQFGKGRFSKSNDWSSSFHTQGGSIMLIWSNEKNVF